MKFKMQHTKCIKYNSSSKTKQNKAIKTKKMKGKLQQQQIGNNYRSNSN